MDSLLLRIGEQPLNVRDNTPEIMPVLQTANQPAMSIPDILPILQVVDTEEVGLVTEPENTVHVLEPGVRDNGNVVQEAAIRTDPLPLPTVLPTTFEEFDEDFDDEVIEPATDEENEEPIFATGTDRSDTGDPTDHGDLTYTENHSQQVKHTGFLANMPMPGLLSFLSNPTIANYTLNGLYSKNIGVHKYIQLNLLRMLHHKAEVIGSKNIKKKTNSAGKRSDILVKARPTFYGAITSHNIIGKLSTYTPIVMYHILQCIMIWVMVSLSLQYVISLNLFPRVRLPNRLMQLAKS